MPSKQNKKRSQTLMRVPRVPRPRLTANTGGETTVVRSRYAAATIITGATQTYGSWYVTPTYTYDPVSNIAKNYSEYRIDRLRITYTPACGTTTPGYVWFGYFDNAEMIDNVRTNTYGPSNMVNVAQTVATNHGTAVWDSFDMNIPLVPRNKWFQINKESPATIEEINRTIQGVIVWGTVSAPISTGIGTFSVDYTITLKGLQNQLYSGI